MSDDIQPEKLPRWSATRASMVMCGCGVGFSIIPVLCLSQVIPPSQMNIIPASLLTIVFGFLFSKLADFLYSKPPIGMALLCGLGATGVVFAIGFVVMLLDIIFVKGPNPFP